MENHKRGKSVFFTFLHSLPTFIAKSRSNTGLQKASRCAGKRKVMTKSNQISRSSCPVSCALDILGDKWTLLVVRDLIFFRKRYFGDFQNSRKKSRPISFLTGLKSWRKAVSFCDTVIRLMRARLFICPLKNAWIWCLQSWSCYVGVQNMFLKVTCTRIWFNDSNRIRWNSWRKYDNPY